MSEARKKLEKETKLEKRGYKLYRPEVTTAELIEAKRRGLLVKRAQPFSLAKGEKPIYTIGKSATDVDRYLVSVSNIDHVSIEELERKLREVDGQEKKTKEEIKRKKEMIENERKRIIKELITVIDARRGDEAHDSSTYFNLARKYKNIPTASRIFQELSEVEDLHKKKLTLLADELDRKQK